MQWKNKLNNELEITPSRCFASLFDHPERSPPSSFLGRFSTTEALEHIKKTILERLFIILVNLQSSVLAQRLFSLLCCWWLHFGDEVNGRISCDGRIGTSIVDLSPELEFLVLLYVLKSLVIQ